MLPGTKRGAGEAVEVRVGGGVGDAGADWGGLWRDGGALRSGRQIGSPKLPDRRASGGGGPSGPIEEVADRLFEFGVDKPDRVSAVAVVTPPAVKDSAQLLQWAVERRFDRERAQVFSVSLS